MSGGRGTPDCRVIPTGCEAAGYESCWKVISSERVIVSEELQAELIALEELQAWLIVWEEFWAWCCLGRALGKVLSKFALESINDDCNAAHEVCGD